MSQTQLGATIKENFLEAGKFYDNGPTIFLLEIQINKDLYNKMSKVYTSIFTDKSFKDHFSNEFSNEQHPIQDGKYFNARSNINNLYTFQDNNFGINSVFSYNNTNKNRLKDFKIDKKVLYNLGQNRYKFIIPPTIANFLLRLTDPLNFRFFILDKNDNVLWTSDVVKPHKSLSDLNDEVSATINISYLNSYLQRLLESSVLNYTENANTIDIRFAESIPDIANANVIEGIIGQNISLGVELFYKNIPLQLAYGQVAVNTLNLNNNNSIAYYLDNVQFVNTFIEDYYSGNDTFVFSLNMSFNTTSNTDVINNIPVFDIALNRSDSRITNIKNKLLTFYNYLINIKLEDIDFIFCNLGNRKVKHKIILDNLDVNLSLDNIRLTEINNQNVPIYFVENTSNVSYLNDFNNLNQLLSVLNIDERGNYYFYTFDNMSPILGQTSFEYKIVYFKNDFRYEKSISGVEVLEDLIDNNSLTQSSLSLITGINDLFTRNVTVNFLDNNINLNNNNRMIRQVQSIKITNANIFNEFASIWGYDNAIEFLSNSIIKIGNYSKFKIIPGDTRLFSNVGFYEFKSIFDVNTASTSNDTINFILSNNEISVNEFNYIDNTNNTFRFLNSNLSLQQKKDILNDIDNTNLEYDNILLIDIFPIHKLLAKYKNKGLDENLNVINFDNNQDEANSVNQIFYNLFYDSQTDLSYSNILQVKESFFKENIPLTGFYQYVNSFILDRIKDSQPESFYNNKNSLNKIQFKDIINDLIALEAASSVSSSAFSSPQNLISLNSRISLNLSNTDTSYAYDFNNKMFDESMSVGSFTNRRNAIYTRLNSTSQRNIVLFFPENVFFKSSFKTNNISLDNATFDIRLNLVPYFLSDDTRSALPVNQDNPFFKSVNYDGKNCITLKNSAYKRENIGYYNILYNGSLNNNTRINQTNNIEIVLNTSKNQIVDFFNKNIFMYYTNSGIIRNSVSLGYNKLYELALNVCILTTINRGREKQFHSEYYQIKLFNLRDENNSLNINRITSISCRRIK